ncbi:DUF695 domain-containing protein [Herbaspirillum sp. C7C8]|jgi:hypothetical protein|uniref:DUF695 domain-containing protein n=1 Tax=Herbaspirillum sp. C7C8 TaxID=2736665 RepID=UPI001F5291C7|nr:DUF695 domain-containing protein [Herbaspirillum sp. C7C8]MCI1003616.1 DUF695 domain-containing protein [Herbaspirillum sp. C7C8]
MTRALLLALLLLLARSGLAQDTEPEWWSYQSQRGESLSLIKLDMSLRRSFPLSGFPYVVVTRVSYVPATPDGLPALPEQDRLEALSDQLAAAIAKKTRSLYVGTAFSQGLQQSWFYVTDPNGLEPVVAGVHAQLCQGCKTSTAILADPTWALYRDQLLPDWETRQRYGLRSY